MGRGKYLAPVDYMTGAIGKGIITRMKVYHQAAYRKPQAKRKR